MKLKSFILGSMLALGSACGGSSNNDGVLFRGLVTQGEEKNSNMLAHEIGEGVPGVQVCSLGSCDTTNRSGRWSFTFNGARDNDVLFTIKEHGADTSFVLNIPQHAKRVEIEKLLHTEVGDHEDGDSHDHEHDTHSHDHDDDAHSHDHDTNSHDHDHDTHSHRLFIKHGGHLHLPSNNQVSVIRVLIDGMEYADAHEFYSHGHDHDDDHHEHDHHDDDDHDHDHGHSH